MKTTFYLIRHGETAWNVQGRMQGHTDVVLGEKGREQAQDVAQTLSHISIDAIYSSPLSRAVETATIISESFDLPVTIDEGLKERNLGALEGKSQAEMRAIYPDWKTMTEEERFKDSREGTESGEETSKRVLHTLEEIAKTNDGKHILAVTHGGNIRFTLVGLGYGTLESIRGIQNCGYAILDYDGENFAVSEVVGIKSSL